MKKIIGIVILIVVVIGLSLWCFRPEKKDPDLIAIVGSREIRVTPFMDEMNRRNNRGRTTIDKKQVLDELILREAMLSKIFEEALHLDPDIQRDYHNLLIGRYKQRYLTPQIDSTVVSDQDIENHYQSNIDRYTQPKKVRLAMIYMKTYPTMSPEKMERIHTKMNECRDKALNMKEGRGFGTLSIQYSEDQPTRYKGGDIGWIADKRKYRWHDLILQAGFALQKIGDISSIIETDQGLYLVKLLDTRESNITPLDKVKEQIRHKLLLIKRKETESQFLSTVVNQTNVTIYSDVLDQIPQPKNTQNVKPPNLIK